MAKKTPQLNARGLYTVITPFSLPTGVVYTCKAIRSFRDIYELGEDVFTQYYDPVGLTQTEFNNDNLANANIITLMADSYNSTQVPSDKTIVYIPDTYIQNYPDQSIVPYSHIVLGLTMGPLPDGLDLSALKTQLGNVCSGVIGTTPVVVEHRAPSAGIVTATEHADLETARLGNVTIRDTDYASLAKAQQDNLLLQAQIATLIQILEDNSLWPPP